MYMNTSPRTAETVSTTATQAPRSLTSSLGAKALALMATVAASTAACTSSGRDYVPSGAISATDSGTSADSGSTYDSGSGFPGFDAGGYPTFDTGTFDTGVNPNPTPDAGTVDTGSQGTDATIDTGADTDTGTTTDTGTATGADGFVFPDGGVYPYTLGAPCVGAEAFLGLPCHINDQTNPNPNDLNGKVVCHEKQVGCSKE